LRLFSFGGYGLALAALALVVFGAYDSYPFHLCFSCKRALDSSPEMGAREVSRVECISLNSPVVLFKRHGKIFQQVHIGAGVPYLVSSLKTAVSRVKKGRPLSLESLYLQHGTGI